MISLPRPSGGHNLPSSRTAVRFPAFDSAGLPPGLPPVPNGPGAGSAEPEQAIAP